MDEGKINVLLQQITREVGEKDKTDCERDRNRGNYTSYKPPKSKKKKSPVNFTKFLKKN